MLVLPDTRPIPFSARIAREKNAQVKQALYDAAMDLFRQKGFDETSVDQITAQAGYGRATFSTILERNRVFCATVGRNSRILWKRSWSAIRPGSISPGADPGSGFCNRARSRGAP